MFLTVHATAGILVGQYTGNIWLGLFGGLISHFMLDIIPHGDNALISGEFNFTQKEVSFLKKLTLIDTSIMTILILFLYWQNVIALSLPILAGIAGGLLPDFLDGIYFLTKHPRLKKYHSFHYSFHFILARFRVSLPIGLGIQLAIVISLVTILFMGS
ncbi:MAG: hypothetical protein KJ621_16570 [Proteobacteria bacterium]|nr:hypothetical protein [Pseudomonadota bacterium]